MGVEIRNAKANSLDELLEEVKYLNKMMTREYNCVFVNCFLCYDFSESFWCAYLEFSK